MVFEICRSEYGIEEKAALKIISIPASERCAEIHENAGGERVFSKRNYTIAKWYDLYHGVPIHRVTCGQERVYYIGQDIHTVYPDVAACRCAIDQKTCTV